MAVSKFSAWVMAARPKTLPAAAVPVIVGSSLAYAEGVFSLLAASLCLFCSFLIQIGTNFANDLGDDIRGADTPERLGPVRAIHLGLIDRKSLKKAVILTFSITFFSGLILVYIGGFPILVIGVLSIISGIIYTTGPFPLAYNGLGDVFSFVFFGVVGTMGTYYVQAKQWSFESFIASIPVGALITAILVVNNYRDREQDKIAHKKTLVVRFGDTFAKTEFIFLFILAFTAPLYLVQMNEKIFDIWVLLPLVTLPFAIKLITMLFTLQEKELNKVLEMTAKYSAVFGALLATGILL